MAWRALGWVVLAGAVPVALVVGALLLLRVAGGARPGAPLLAGLVLTAAYLFVPVVLWFRVLRPRELGWRDLGVTRPAHTPWHLLWQIPLTLVVATAASALVLTALGLGDDGARDPDALDALTLSGPAGVIAALLVVAGLVPVVEELVFRGIVLAALRARLLAPAATLASAVIFAGVHLLPPALPYLFVAGIALALMAQWYRSIVPGMVMHSVNNAVVVAAVLAAA